MNTATKSKSVRLRELINRKDKVLAVMQPPSAAHARIMEMSGCEAGYVGTGAVTAAYTGLSDVGTITMTESLTVGRWIAETVNFPIIQDGDTGHGGIMAVRRLVRECIHAGMAGVRINDQPIEGKRSAASAGMEVVPLAQAIVRYRAAVDMKNELDPNFVIMSQCFARDESGSSIDKTIARLKAYKEEAGVDWVQLQAPRSVEEIKLARAAISGPFSFIGGRLPRILSLKEHLDLGFNIAWYVQFCRYVTYAAVWDFMQAYQEKNIGAWEDFLASRKDRPYPIPKVGPEGEGIEKQRELEERYFPAAMFIPSR